VQVPQPLQRGPRLAGCWDEPAARRCKSDTAGRSLGGRILRAAGGTNEGWHESRIPQGRRDGHFRSCLLYGFLTTAANVVLAPIHEKAMPVIATTYEEPDI
jgi:putative SOS response-associated peptidase YedK